MLDGKNDLNFHVADRWKVLKIYRQTSEKKMWPIRAQKGLYHVAPPCPGFDNLARLFVSRCPGWNCPAQDCRGNCPDPGAEERAELDAAPGPGQQALGGERGQVLSGSRPGHSRRIQAA